MQGLKESISPQTTLIDKWAVVSAYWLTCFVIKRVMKRGGVRDEPNPKRLAPSERQ